MENHHKKTLNNKQNIKLNLINKVKNRAKKISISSNKNEAYWQALLVETQKLSEDNFVKKIINSQPQSSYC